MTTATAPEPGAQERAAADTPTRAAPAARPAPPVGSVQGVRLLDTLVMVATLVVVAGLGFHRVFALGDLAPVIAVSTMFPLLLSALISWPRRRTPPLWISIVASVVGWILVASFNLFNGDFTAVGGALRDSWKGILTSLLPAPGQPALLVLPHVLLWFAAVAGAESALRTRSRAAPALPAVIVFAVALPLGVGGPGSNLYVAAALVGLVATLVILRNGGRPGRVLAGVAAALILPLLAAIAGPVLPIAGSPYDPRQNVKPPPPLQRDSVSPLDRVSAWLQTPDQQMFTVHSTAAENWRLAVLDRFDGVTWTSGAHFVPVGNRIPGNGDTSRTRVEQSFTIHDLPGIWVPAADRPQTIDGLGVSVDPSTGVLASAQLLHSGQTFKVTSMVREYKADELAGADAASDAEARAAVALPESPGTTAKNAQVPDFRKLAERITQDKDSGFQRAAALAEYLRTSAEYDVSGLPGHTYAQLAYFIGRTKRGTSEQFATAYAVLARSIGLPTRVVVGFRPGIGADGAYQVRSGDVLVWPEVDFNELGWVPFFPTPEQRGRSQHPSSVPSGQTQQKLEAAQKTAALRKKGSRSGTHDQPRPAPPVPRTPPEKPTPWWVYVLAVAPALPVVYFLGVLFMPVLRRRRRRRAPTPSARIAGAWRQTVEDLHAVGLPAPTTLTAHEVAGFGARRVSSAEPHLRPLAELVNRSKYAAESPGPDAAEAAWEHTDQVGRLVGQVIGRIRRVSRRLHPRSLRLR